MDFNIFNRKKETPVVPDKIGNMEGFSMANDFELPKQSYYKSNRGYLFGDNGLFPQELNNLYGQSPLHSAIINYKTLLTSGEGLELFGAENLDIKSKISVNQIFSQLRDIDSEVAMDFYIHSRICLKITWNKDKTKMLKIERLNPETIRIAEVSESMVPTSFYYNWDWENTSAFNTVQYPTFSQYGEGDVQILHYQDNSPNKKLYVEPSYISAISWTYLDAEMSVYHKSNITNSLNPSMLIQFFEKPGSPEEKHEILQGLNSSFGGAKKTGRAMVTFSDGSELAPSITQMDPNKLDKTFLTLTDTIQRQICYAANIDPQLLGLKTPGSLGNSGEIEYSYTVFNKSVIQPSQRKIERLFNELLEKNSLGVKVKYRDVEIITTTEENKTK